MPCIQATALSTPEKPSETPLPHCLRLAEAALFAPVPTAWRRLESFGVAGNRRSAQRAHDRREKCQALQRIPKADEGMQIGGRCGVRFSEMRGLPSSPRYFHEVQKSRLRPARGCR